MNTGRIMYRNRRLVVLSMATAALIAMGPTAYAYAADEASQVVTVAAASGGETEATEETQTTPGTTSEPEEQAEENQEQDETSAVTPSQEPATDVVQPSGAVVTDETAEVDEEEEPVSSQTVSGQANTSARRVAVTTDSAVDVTVVFSGPDGEWERSDLSIEEDSTAWEASLIALSESSLVYETGSSTADDVIVSLARSYDEVPCTLDTITGSAWHLYLNGERYKGSASTLNVGDGNVLEWRFDVGTVVVSVSVVGPGGTGLDYWIAPTSVEVEATQSAWDTSRIVFEQNGYVDGRLLSYTVGEDGSVELDSLASLGASGITGETWQVFINGVRPEENVALTGLRSGDSICWYYAGNGENELPTFVAKTGAASQSPAAMVRLDGNVSQAWTRKADDAAALVSRINASTGVAVSGAEGTWSIAAVKQQPFAGTVAFEGGSNRWNTSLAHLMDAKLGTGQGGRAAFGSDGGLYYLDDLGAVVKLELTE